MSINHNASSIASFLLSDQFKILKRECPSGRRQKKWDLTLDIFKQGVEQLVDRLKNRERINRKLLEKVITRIDRLRESEARFPKTVYETIFGAKSQYDSLKLDLEKAVEIGNRRAYDRFQSEAVRETMPIFQPKPGQVTGRVKGWFLQALRLQSAICDWRELGKSAIAKQLADVSMPRREEEVSSAIEAAWKSMEQRETGENLFKSLVENGIGIEEALKAARQHSNVERTSGLRLYEFLIQNGHGIGDAIAYASRAVLSGKSMGTILFKSLIEKGRGIEIAIETAYESVMDGEYEGVELFKCLIQHGYGVEEAFEAAQYDVDLAAFLVKCKLAEPTDFPVREELSSMGMSSSLTIAAAVTSGLVYIWKKMNAIPAVLALQPFRESVSQGG